MKTAAIVVAGTNDCELRAALEFEGYRVAKAETARETMQQTASERYDVLMLDSSIEATSVHKLCRAVREKSNLGIIVLDRDAGTQHRIDALNAGADDYVAVPFILPELLARVRAILRRVAASREADRPLVLEDRSIDFGAHEVRGPDGRVSHLTPKEFMVLQQLVANANEPRTHQSLAHTVWQRDGSGDVEYVRIVIRQLRRKLEPDPDKPRYILTDRSVGYRFQIPSPVGQ